MSLEDKLKGWTGPSSATEQEKQERAERMVRQAVRAHKPFEGHDFRVYTKGSYANNTNVRSDSDVDIAVRCTDAYYWDEAKQGLVPRGGSYSGIWTPSKLRAELAAAMRVKFPGAVDTSGSTAIRVNANTARVDADVVPCFNYRYYLTSTTYREGAMIITKDGTRIKNYSEQQLKNGRAKNTATRTFYKQAVRIMKRVENAMVEAKYHREVPSYLVECLVYNVPNEILLRSTWVATIKGVTYHIYSQLQGDTEPTVESHRWLEVNEWKFLFNNTQPWSRADARDFAYAAWNYLGLKA